MLLSALFQLAFIVGVPLLAAGADIALCDRLRERAAGIPPSAISPPPLLNGDDLVALGITPGPELGELLEALYRAQLNERISTRQQAVAMVRMWIGSRGG